ncbi:MAG: hypothetical protein K8F52_07660 [Candidatus Scalindua rubra]|uniref:Uncharacterized protein n=1 Tax=Candidatus Scalindua brodae TaxID=237368 RepID=A0A0B0EJ18_9BACT|nr:MAG: hypothetical protein SCABRO_03568 [Candidatus Scalindua brodae]MBZ0108531.1 hypothetical protein [Candidatus Scalindua rubra]
MSTEDLLLARNIENREERLRIQDRVVQALKEVERLKTDFQKIDDELELMLNYTITMFSYLCMCNKPKDFCIKT